MGANIILQVILSFLVPPLAVINKGWDKLAIVTGLWLITGIGGPVAALYFVADGRAYDRWKRRRRGMAFDDAFYTEKPKHAPRRLQEGTYIERSDGEILEVIDTEMVERNRRLRG